MSARKPSIYRIFFTSQGKGYELYARQVGPSELHGFVEITGILFGERSRIVVDPGEEALRNEFGSVRRMLVPYHAVNRIDEGDKEGAGKILPLPSALSGNLPIPQPGSLIP
jgi:hypothetical protein